MGQGDAGAGVRPAVMWPWEEVECWAEDASGPPGPLLTSCLREGLIAFFHAPSWLPLWAAWPPHGFQGEGKDLGPARVSRTGQVSSQPSSDPRLLPSHPSIQSHLPTNATPCQAMCLATGRLPPLWARLADTLGRGS